MKKLLFLMIGLILIAVSGSSYSQGFAPVGTAAAQFLEVGIGARQTAMGNAFTAMNNDASAVFWNPAGLSDVQKGDFVSSYCKWPADITLVGVSYAYNLKNIGVLALSGVYLMTGDMEVTSILQPQGTGEMFNIGNYSFGLSYARALTDRFSVGLTGKMIHEKYWTYGYTSWAVDIGTMYRTSFHGLRIGMSILHFGPDVRYDGTFIDYSDPKSVDVDKTKKFNTFSLPVNFRFGAAIDVLNNEQHRVTAAADMVHPNNNLEQYNFGMEYGFRQLFFLRAGYQTSADEGGLAMGVGVKTQMAGHLGLVVDYSYADLGILTSAHRVTLGVSY
jgi:hypothetical protein